MGMKNFLATTFKNVFVLSLSRPKVIGVKISFFV